jgi:hypothetical protein
MSPRSVAAWAVNAAIEFSIESNEKGHITTNGASVPGSAPPIPRSTETPWYPGCDPNSPNRQWHVRFDVEGMSNRELL